MSSSVRDIVDSVDFSSSSSRPVLDCRPFQSKFRRQDGYTQRNLKARDLRYLLSVDQGMSHI
jgi:hypothetical protein